MAYGVVCGVGSDRIGFLLELARLARDRSGTYRGSIVSSYAHVSGKLALGYVFVDANADQLKQIRKESADLEEKKAIHVLEEDATIPTHAKGSVALASFRLESPDKPGLLAFLTGAADESGLSVQSHTGRVSRDKLRFEQTIDFLVSANSQYDVFLARLRNEGEKEWHIATIENDYKTIHAPYVHRSALGFVESRPRREARRTENPGAARGRLLSLFYALTADRRALVRDLAEFITLRGGNIVYGHAQVLGNLALLSAYVEASKDELETMYSGKRKFEQDSGIALFHKPTALRTVPQGTSRVAYATIRALDMPGLLEKLTTLAAENGLDITYHAGALDGSDYRQQIELLVLPEAHCNWVRFLGAYEGLKTQLSLLGDWRFGELNFPAEAA